MPGELILAIDQGTHSTRAVVFDVRGRLIAISRKPVSLHARSRTEVEQSADEILDSMNTVVDDILRHPDVATASIQAAGLATQRSSVLAWERGTGTALSPVLSWQDRRTADALRAFEIHDADIRQRTGLHLSPHYGAGKLQWLLSHAAAVGGARASGSLVMGPLASYLLHHLIDGAGEMADHANASRTLLWNLARRDWDDWLLELFAIPREVLPDCYPILADYGVMAQGNIPLRAVNGDQTSALYAQGRPSAKTVLVNIGTGAFILLPVADPDQRDPGLLAGISLSDRHGGSYYIEGTVNGAAAAVHWAEKQFNETDLKDKLPVWLDAVQDPPVFLNTIGGLGAPWWRAGPEPVFLGDTPAGPAAMVAVIESIVFLIQANVALMCAANPTVDRIQVTGGLSNLDGLCQRLADISGLPVYRPLQVEATARGIAWQAAGCPDDWPPTGPGETFDPAGNAPLNSRYRRFLEALGLQD